MTTNNPPKVTQPGTEKGYDCARQDRQPCSFIIIGGALVPHELGQDGGSLGRMFELFQLQCEGTSLGRGFVGVGHHAASSISFSSVSMSP
ncbi:MAG: hypothetical protein WBP56_10905 [Polyangia bacterium]